MVKIALGPIRQPGAPAGDRPRAPLLSLGCSECAPSPECGLTSSAYSDTIRAHRPASAREGAYRVQPGDSEVIEYYLRGDAEAVDKVDQWILQSARSFRRSLAQDWDDTLQEVRLEVLRLLRQGRFRGDANLKTYVWRVVSHSCLDRLRARRRWLWTNLEDRPEMDNFALGKSRESSGWRESKDLLLRVLGRTSPECRRLWSMILSGLSYREMSQKLGVSEGTLRVRVLRCRKRALEIRDDLLAAGKTG